MVAAEYRVFWLPRRGNAPEEYEDAFGADPATGRFAVADGATEAAFARDWARLLVEDFVRHGQCSPQSWTDRLPLVQERWQAAVGQQPLPWYVKDKFRRGAFATFLGLTISSTEGDDASLAWQAVAVGDACLLHTRAAGLLAAFPLSRAEQFGNHPNLVGSRSPADDVRRKRCVHARGDAAAGDRLWLMTDALAQWCLARHEGGNAPWEALESLRLSPETDAAFARWIAALDRDGLRNDDVTLVAIGLYVHAAQPMCRP